jgi:hypothetical protein
MENERKKIYDFLKSKKHITTTPYNEWVVKYFSDTEGAKKIFDFLSKKKYYTNPIEDFYKKYCCDLEWAKTTNYCVGGDKPEEQEYNPEEKTISITQQQQNLVDKGYFIGTSGPNKNGVDGTLGEKTQYAQHALDSGIDAKTYNNTYKQLYPDLTQTIENLFGKQTPNEIPDNPKLQPKDDSNNKKVQPKDDSDNKKVQVKTNRVIKTINPNNW